MILLNPGPSNTTEGVKRALGCDDECPREAAFGDVMRGVADRLARLASAEDDAVAVLFAGSGTAAVEAAIASAVPAEGRLLVLDNGAYGARMAEIAAAYGMAHDVLRFGVGGVIDVERVAERLGHGAYTHAAVVHHETTTGMLNPVDRVGAVCRGYGVELIVDAMSSFAGIPFTLEGLGAGLVVSSANKCLQAMAGLSFVIGRRDRVAAMERAPGRSLYLDLGAQHRFFERTGQMRFTPPLQLVHALRRALEELDDEGGPAGRRRRYDRCFEVLDGGMRSLGFERLLPAEQLSRILTAYVEPDDPRYDYDTLHDALRARGFTIYPGKGARVGTFRLANMGAIEPDDMSRFVDAMRDAIGELGFTP